MRALLAVVVLVWVKGAAAQVVEVFVDQGETFLRAGKNQGLSVGVEVAMLGERIGDTEDYRPGGSATVMEVFDTVARVVLDEQAVQAGSRLARVPMPAESAPPPDGSRQLVGGAVLSGFGPIKRIKVSNQTQFDWTKCDLRLPNNKHYKVGTLRAGDSEGIMVGRFSQDGMEVDKPIDGLIVRCAEGRAKFVFSMPP